jgi:hypothetical protein
VFRYESKDTNENETDKSISEYESFDKNHTVEPSRFQTPHSLNAFGRPVGSFGGVQDSGVIVSFRLPSRPRCVWLVAFFS